MKKIIKVISTSAMAMVVAISMSISASAYYLNYTKGAPSNVNVLTCTDTVNATGEQSIKIQSNIFNTYISGAYVEAYSTTHSTTSAIISTPNTTYYLQYLGTTVPKPNVTVRVYFELKNYVVSQQVTASGTTTA